MFQKIKNLIYFFVLATVCAQASTVQFYDGTESDLTSVKGVKICHQNDWRHLNVILEFQTSNDQACTTKIRKHLKDFLIEYDNPNDFWEVMNKKYVRLLKSDFPELISIKSTFTLEPDRSLSFPRRSIVCYNAKEKNILETFGYSKLNYKPQSEMFDDINLHIIWGLDETKDEGIQYPDYLWVDEKIDYFFQHSSKGLNSWSEIKPLLVKHLLEQFSDVTYLDIQITTN